MANQNVRTPRFYTDNINYLLSRGVAQDGNFDVRPSATNGATTIGLQTGTEAECFDMNPLNKVDFDTSATTDGHVIINLDLKGSLKNSFVAILNHNLSTARGKIRISASDTESEVQSPDFSGATAISCTEVVNADAISTNIITPATDGSTIVRFSESDLRYWGIQFEGDSTFLSTDLFFGCILVGEYWDAAHAPDLSVQRSIMFDKTKVLESVGGKRFSNMNNHGRTASSASKSPFTTASNNYETYGGRIAYDMNFSYLASTDLMPDEYDTLEYTDDAFVEDVWNKTNGSHIPFILSIDNSTTEEGGNAETQHIFARFAQNELQMNQVANDFWNISLRIEEEF